MVRIDWTPGEKQLKRFGWIGLAGFPLIGGAVSLAAPESDPMGIWIVFGALALACGLFARFSPRRLKPIYLLVSCIAFVVFLPVTLIFRGFGWVAADPPSAGKRSGSGNFGGKAEDIPDDGGPEE